MKIILTLALDPAFDRFSGGIDETGTFDLAADSAATLAADRQLYGRDDAERKLESLRGAISPAVGG